MEGNNKINFLDHHIATFKFNWNGNIPKYAENQLQLIVLFQLTFVIQENIKSQELYSY